MNEIRDAILRMVRSALSAKKMADAYLAIGWDDCKPHQIYGDLLDAIYSLIGETVDEFNLSITYVAMTAPFLSDERRVKLLMSEYEKNHKDVNIEQPKPYFFSPEEMRKMKKNKDGYQSPEGDWLT